MFRRSTRIHLEVIYVTVEEELPSRYDGQERSRLRMVARNEYAVSGFQFPCMVKVLANFLKRSDAMPNEGEGLQSNIHCEACSLPTVILFGLL
jgi:hypothetical protein